MPDYLQPLSFGFATGIVMVFMPRLLALPIAFLRKLAERA